MDYFKEKELLEIDGRLQDINQRQEDILKAAENEGRDLTSEEERKFDKLEQEFKKTKLEKRKIQNQVETDSGLSQSKVLSVGNSRNQDVETWESVSGPSKGDEVRVLGSGASLQRELRNQYPEEFEKLGDTSWASYLRSRIQGYTANNPLQPGETRVMDTTADSSLVPTPLSAEVIDKARNQSRIFKAGARTVPMDSKTLDIARVTDDVDTEWKAENASFSPSDVTVDKVTFTAKTLIAGTKMSVELSEDAPNASEVIRNSLAESLALELDRVGLVGSGSGSEPEGLYNNANIQEVSMGANGTVIDDFTELSKAYQKVLEANGEPASAIFAPRTWGQIDRLVDGQQNPLRHPQSWENLQKLVTNQVPIDQDQGTSTGVSSSVFTGDFRQMLVGMRTNLRIEVSRVASDSTNSAWEDLQVWIRAYMRADIQLALPKHFCRVVGLIE